LLDRGAICRGAVLDAGSGMPRLLTFYLARRIALAALLIETSLCIPVVMTSLVSYLPPAAVRSGLVVPALLGTLPTVLYIALPMAVGIAIALEFSRMSSEGMIAVLYSLRLSVWSIAMPAVLVATFATGLGYFISSVLAPAYVGQMHDVIHIIRNSLNHRMLEPAHFYTFDNGTRTLYFQRWRSPDVVSGMFIHQFSAEKNEEQIITAETTEFRRNEHGVVMIMSQGSIESRQAGSSTMHSANFDEYVIPIDMQGSGGLPQRNWRGVFELPFGEFFSGRPDSTVNERLYAEWMSEATKRFALPLLALAHTLLAIGVVLTFSSATGRRNSTVANLSLIVVPAAHIAILIGAETLVRKDPHLVWLVVFAICVEFAAALFMIYRRNANFAPVSPGPRLA
jgi:lipopolysaccharide export system permease protein